MNVDEETRKAFHEIRDVVHTMQLNSAVANGEVKSSITALSAQVTSMNEKMQQMVTKPEFLPVKMICYGMTAIILSGALGALLSLIFINK